MSAPERAPRFDCHVCQFAYECGSKAWHCDQCESSHDLRTGAQFSMMRDDGEVNQAQASGSEKVEPLRGNRVPARPLEQDGRGSSGSTAR